MLNRFPISSRAALWFVLAGVWATSFVYASTPLNDTIWCPWRRLTGLDCPGCGLTRSFCAMSHLRPQAAFQAHPVGPLLYTAMAWFVSVDAIRHLRANERLLELPNKVISFFWAIVVAIFTIHFIKTVLSWT